MIIYWLPRGSQAVFPAQWTVRRFEIFEAPEGTKKIYTSQPLSFPLLEILLLEGFLELKWILWIPNRLSLFCNFYYFKVLKKTQCI